MRTINQRFVYAPNYWQWFAHQKNHGLLPDEIKNCQTQLDLIKYLGLDIFSRNIYCIQDEYWFGGICEEYIEGGEINIENEFENRNKKISRKYLFNGGELNEKLEYVFNDSTIVQREFLIKDFETQSGLLEKLVASRKWKFNKLKFEKIKKEIGTEGEVIIGDFYSPLKLLHLTMNPVNAIYFLLEFPKEAKIILQLHEKAQLEAIEQCVSNGVQTVMAMDNLDVMFHPPQFIENYSASFYEKASNICHKHDAKFFIHACGQQKDNLKLISSLGVDGLEGVAFPPFGDVELVEALEMTPDNFIITGGITASTATELKTKDKVFDYVKTLFTQLKPYKHRFIFSASCNTPINMKWETIKYFRDAWLEYNLI